MILAFSKSDTDKHGLHRYIIGVKVWRVSSESRQGGKPILLKANKSVKICENLCPIFQIAKLLRFLCFLCFFAAISILMNIKNSNTKTHRAQSVD